ncbi:MAG: hypothetical protein ACI9RL_000315 [Candidatus Paceibacteria bacterium]
MLLVTLLVIFLSLPSVQTKLAVKLTDHLQTVYDAEISIDRIGLNWLGKIDARGVHIKDHHQDTLIYSKQVQTNILSFSNAIKGDVSLGYIKLTDAKLFVKTYKDELKDNMYTFVNSFNSGTKRSSIFKLFGDDVVIENSHIKITDENLSSPLLFDLKKVHAVAKEFRIIGPEFFANVQSISLSATRGFEIEALKTQFSYTPKEMILKDMKLQTAQSMLLGDLVMNYETNGFSDFENTVVFRGDFLESKIATNDLNGFYNEFGTNQILDFKGSFNGTLNDFSFTKGSIGTGNTKIAGDFYFKDLVKGTNAFKINFKRHDITTSYYDLRRFLPNILGPLLPDELKNLGVFDYDGNTQINTTKLVTKATFLSGIGRAEAILTIDDYSNTDRATYSGNLILSAFDIGLLTETSALGKVSANLDFDGRGFTQQTLDMRLQGNISSFGFEGYDYKNISIQGALKDPVFNGDLAIDDPNVQLNFKGLVDVSKAFNQYDFEADVYYAELNKLNLFKRDSISVFTGKVRVDMDGTTIDDVVGSFSFQETFYQNEHDDFYFDDFNIISSFENEERVIDINSPDIVNGKVSGKFLIQDISNLFRNGLGSMYANYIPEEVTTNQYIDYDLSVYNKIIEVFVPQIQLGENSRIKGSVSSDKSKFQLDFKSPEMLFNNNYFGKVRVQVDNDNPLYNTYVSVDSVYTGVYDVIDFSLINKTYNDTLYVQSVFKGGPQKEDLFDLALYYTINPEGKSVVGIKKSEISYKKNSWFVNETNNKKNKVVFDDRFNSIAIDSLQLNYNEEEIAFAGVIRDSTYKDLKVRFKDVNIGNIIPSIDSLQVSGNTNGTLSFLHEKGAYYPNSNITIDNVIINTIAFGDLTLDIDGNEDLTKYTVNTTLINEYVKSIGVIGTIDLAPKETQIDLDVRLNEFNLQALTPFGANVLTDIRGEASGALQIIGNYKAPELLGRINLKNSGLKIPYLNVDFDLANSTQMIVSKDTLQIIATEITDTKFDTKGIFSGKAVHNNFRDWLLDLDILAQDRLLVLDTPPDDDELYYGTSFISGNADIIGPIDALAIKVFATTEQGTTFKIPLSDTESIGDDSFIKFLSPEEKRASIIGRKIIKKEIKGLSVDFDLDINKNAEVEVVIDKVNNSTLKGRGAGTLLIRLDTKGKFNMWGEFTVIEGLYDFRYSGIIQKKIAVVPGGNINWDGEPDRARLNISAKYGTDANPAVLLDNPSFNRKIPVDVLVDLTGEIIQPELNFRIDFPRTGSTVKSELEFKLQNKEDREKQAIFLLTTGSFVNDGLGGANFAGTLADRVSNLVNELFADEEGKFNIGLDYSQGSRLPNQETADRVGISLQSQINERILINGKVGIPVGGANETAIAGDIEVQWLINEDGTLRMNFFNRQADIQFIGEDQIFEQGLGMSYSVDFNTLSELMEKLFNKKLTVEKQETEAPFVPDDTSFPATYNEGLEK